MGSHLVWRTSALGHQALSADPGGRLNRYPHPAAAAVNWTPQAESRLKEVPFFVRPVVRKRIESLAAEAGQSEVTESFYDQARAQFGQS